MILVSQAPVEKLQADRERLGWSFPWASSYESDFNSDLGIRAPAEAGRASGCAALPPIVEHNAADCGTDPAGYMTERPGLSMFALEDGEST